ncbi:MULTISPECIES: N-acetylglucosamine-6-phosphate deacetylase [unclassified Sphingobacterium]|uniref:N-acetylglucosamine-6-phosphate deacetylase n=1 Tax=unclassified Sphingobacterium TaxID=2609468 RepID=UPI0025E458E2|nr:MULTISPECIES: N-acetylglucosamine-6-phosphate deacetylase [unclassified Sphingobacterium]
MQVKIINAKLILQDYIIPDGSLLIRDGKIVEIHESPVETESDETVIDAEGMYVSPGFIDIHVHGGGGADIMDNTVEAFLIVAATHAKYGTTALLPTTLTSETADLIDLFHMYEQALLQNKDGARFLGLHLEGPYFAMNQRGAQDPRYIRDPDPAEYEPILRDYHHLIARWSAAPELPGALIFGRKVREKDILLALAHTDAVYGEIIEGLESGYNLATHLYSGMSGMTRKNAYRYAGTIESCLLLDDIHVEIIADGVHLPAPFLQLIHKTKGTERITLITDAMRAAGMPEGKSVLGSLRNGLEVIVEDGVAKLPDRSSFAGSVATMDRLIRTMLSETSVSLLEVIRMVSINPARLIKKDQEIGSIAIGKDADLVFFDKDINIHRTIIQGRSVYEKEK